MIKEKKIPSGYKASHFGPIPSDWQVMKIEDISEDKKGSIKIGPFGSQLKKEDFVEKGIKVYDQETAFSSNFQKGTNFISDQKYSTLKSCEINPGDVIISMMGTIGAAAIVPINAEKGILNSHLLRIKPNKKIISAEYLKISIADSPITIKQIERKSHGGIMSGLSASIVRSIEITVPLLPEQTAIANLLSTWDKAIQTTNALIEQKQNRKKWLMQMLLTGKKRLKGFEKEKWKMYSYENVLKVVKRPFEMHDDELYNLISVRRRSGGIFAREPLLGKQILVKQLRTANEGDFLFSKMQILHGASALVTKEFAGFKISGSYIAAVAQDPKTLNLEFFEWYSRLPIFYHQTYISSYGVHIEKMTFDWDSFMGLGLKLPSVEEQKEIVNVLNTSAKEIKLLQIQLDQLKEQKKGLMQILLTGKKRLAVN